MSLPSFTRHQSTSHRGPLGERGATLLEAAMVLPLFLLLIFGIMEFSYAMAQNNEIRHVSREASRELGVNPGADALSLVCNGVDLIEPSALSVSLNAAGAEAGESAEITVSATYRTLTGLLDGMFAGVAFETSHRFAVDQPFDGGAPGWAPGFGATGCP